LTSFIGRSYACSSTLGRVDTTHHSIDEQPRALYPHDQRRLVQHPLRDLRLRRYAAAVDDDEDRRVSRRFPWTGRRGAVGALFGWLQGQALFPAIAGVGHRVVHGLKHPAPARVTPALLAELRRLIPYAPEHLPRAIALITAFNERFPMLAIFCYQAKEWLGSFGAALGGVDTLVFAGGIGENAPSIRRRICNGLGFLGVRIDARRNRTDAPVISAASSRVTVRVVPTDEALMIATSIERSLRLGAPGGEGATR
jgi:acetate kinase